MNNNRCICTMKIITISSVFCHILKISFYSLNYEKQNSIFLRRLYTEIYAS